MLHSLINLGTINNTDVVDSRHIHPLIPGVSGDDMHLGRIAQISNFVIYKYKATIWVNHQMIIVYFVNENPDLEKEPVGVLNSPMNFIIYIKIIINNTSAVILHVNDINNCIDRYMSKDNIGNNSVITISELLIQLIPAYDIIINDQLQEWDVSQYTPLETGIGTEYIDIICNSDNSVEDLDTNDTIDALMESWYNNNIRCFLETNNVYDNGFKVVTSLTDTLNTKYHPHQWHTLNYPPTPHINLSIPNNIYHTTVYQAIEYIIKDPRDRFLLSHNHSECTHHDVLYRTINSTYPNMIRLEIMKQDNEFIYFIIHNGNSIFTVGLDIFLYILSCDSLVNSLI